MDVYCRISFCRDVKIEYGNWHIQGSSIIWTNVIRFNGFGFNILFKSSHKGFEKCVGNIIFGLAICLNISPKFLSSKGKSL